MLENIKPDDVLFLDIETAPCAPAFDDLEDHLKKLWEKKSGQFRTAEQTAKDVYQRAGIYAEFGKIVCISVGFLKDRNPYGIRLKSFYGEDEKVLLADFSELLAKSSRGRDLTLCAHNGKEFDYPYIARRMIINGMTIPAILDNAGKKPWEVKLLDTLELWKFGDYKSFTSLALLSAVLGIPSPKDDIDGSMVADVYWKEKDLVRIARYCEKDVLTVARVLLRFMNLQPLSDEKVESVTQFI
jgi:3'-5' exonuclease